MTSPREAIYKGGVAALLLLLLEVLALAAESQAPASSVAIAWWPYALVAAVVVTGGGVALAMSLKKRPAGEEPCPNCGKMMMADWPRCMFCKTPRGFRQAALQVVSGPLAGRSIPLESEVTTIGTAAGSTLTLSDAGVSRKHAGIRRADGGFELADLGSTNGVYVNGEKVARRMLRTLDVIRIGTTEMVFKN